jgi:hypothetical protein
MYSHCDDFILAKEDIDASMDSTYDHVMYWIGYICNIHFY